MCYFVGYRRSVTRVDWSCFEVLSVFVDSGYWFAVENVSVVMVSLSG